LAISAGQPIKAFGECNGQTLSLLSDVYEQGLVSFAQ